MFYRRWQFSALLFWNAVGVFVHGFISKRRCIMKSLSTRRLTYACLIAIALSGSSLAVDFTINWNDVHQRITGFGAAMDDAGQAARTIVGMPDARRIACMDILYDSVNGIGLSMIRSSLVYDYQGNVEGGAWKPNFDSCQAWVMQQAQKRGVTLFWSAPWTPPYWMKTQQVKGGGSLATEHYQDYADYQTKFVTEMKNRWGVPISYLSVQNEPHFTPPYGGCYYDDQMILKYVRDYLGPTLARANLKVPVLISDDNLPAVAQQVKATLDDPAASKYVGVIAYHVYEGAWPAPFPRAAQMGKEYWETETSFVGGADDGWPMALSFAYQCHTALVDAENNAWHYWEILASDREGVLRTAPGGQDFVITKWCYYFGHFSKFVRPGYYRIATTPSSAKSTGSGAVLVSAFKYPPTGRFAIVLVNNDISKPGPTVTFHFNGVSPASVTPCFTSGEDAAINLQKQADIPVVNGTFSYTIPNVAIATFAGNGTPTPAVSSLPEALPVNRGIRVEIVRGGIALHTPRAGAYYVELTGLNGKKLAAWNAAGAGDHLFATNGIGANAGIVRVSGPGIAAAQRLLWVK
jgi:O-glycosyl hydrolase